MKKLKKLTCLLLCAIGLSAHAQFMATTNTATAAWNPVVDPNLTSYQLFDWTGTLTNVASVPSSQTNVQIVNLHWSATYTLAVKSVAQQGTNIQSSVLSAPITLITPAQPPPPLLPPATPSGLKILGP
jgi:hypothetical protein